MDRIGEDALEPVLRQMERLNADASRLALEHGVHAATDVTGFGLTGHALGMARASGAGLRFVFERLPVHDGFYKWVEKGISTGCTGANEENVSPVFTDRAGLDRIRREVLFDPQTSGGLLLSTPAGQAGPLLEALLASGHRAAEVGEVLEGPARIEIV